MTTAVEQQLLHDIRSYCTHPETVVRLCGNAVLAAESAAAKTEWQIWRHAIEDVRASSCKSNVNETCTRIIEVYEQRKLAEVARKTAKE